MTIDLKGLKLFNEKGEKLENSRFLRNLLTNGNSTTISWSEGNSVQIQTMTADDDSRDSFILTLRFFIQDNEKSSFRNMSKIYNSLPDDKKFNQLKKNFNEARTVLNDFLDRELDIKMNLYGEKVTNRLLFETFIFGELAHSNQHHEKRYKMWVANPILGSLIKVEFNNILYKILKLIKYVREVNKEVLGLIE